MLAVMKARTSAAHPLQIAGLAADELRSRQLACLLGGAIGDAVGYRVEFKRWPEIERMHGPSGITLAAAAGPLLVSDDTQMTLFTLEGLARATSQQQVIPEIRDAYLDWFGTQRPGWAVGDRKARWRCSRAAPCEAMTGRTRSQWRSRGWRTGPTARARRRRSVPP